MKSKWQKKVIFFSAWDIAAAIAGFLTPFIVINLLAPILGSPFPFSLTFYLPYISICFALHFAYRALDKRITKRKTSWIVFAAAFAWWHVGTFVMLFLLLPVT